MTYLVTRTPKTSQKARLRLLNGPSAQCSYTLSSPNGGDLYLPSGLDLPVRSMSEGTLLLADGQERRVHVAMGPKVGEAAFLFDT